MRVVSWIVVIVSVGWISVFHLGPGIGDFGFPEIEMNQIAGTTAPPRSNSQIRDFASRYTAAWNSHDPIKVAAHYATHGSITINGGDPYQGTAGLVKMADGFITEFPDIELTMDSLEEQDGRVVFHWTFTGTHSETGNRVRIHGSESWRLGEDGLIAESIGQFDPQEYERQVAGGTHN